MINEKEMFLTRKVNVRKNDDFVLYGRIKSFEEHGIWLDTGKEISFITYNNIKEIRLSKEQDY